MKEITASEFVHACSAAQDEIKAALDKFENATGQHIADVHLRSGRVVVEVVTAFRPDRREYIDPRVFALMPPGELQPYQKAAFEALMRGKVVDLKSVSELPVGPPLRPVSHG